MPGFHVSLSAKNHRPFDGIAQLPHIARPVVSHQPVQHLPVDSLDLPPVLGVHVGKQASMIAGMSSLCSRSGGICKLKTFSR